MDFQTSASCTNGTPAAVTVVSGATTICTFINTQASPPLKGSIQVVKNTVGGNGTFAFTSNFGLSSLTTVSGTANQTFGNLTAGGSYSVSETVPSGWTQTSASCTNGTFRCRCHCGEPGATTVCTFTNTQQGSIKIVEGTRWAATAPSRSPAHGRADRPSNHVFGGTVGLSSLTTVSGTANLAPGNLTAGGSYSVSETVPVGWTQTNAHLHERNPRCHHRGERGNNHLHFHHHAGVPTVEWDLSAGG